MLDRITNSVYTVEAFSHHQSNRCDPYSIVGVHSNWTLLDVLCATARCAVCGTVVHIFVCLSFNDGVINDRTTQPQPRLYSSTIQLLQITTPLFCSPIVFCYFCFIFIILDVECRNTCETIKNQFVTEKCISK